MKASNMPECVVGKIADALNQRDKPVRCSRILMLGTAYKKNVDDMRESPSVALMEILRTKGADIEYSDPMCKLFQDARLYFRPDEPAARR